MSARALSLQRNEEAQCRWGAVGRIHSEVMKRNMNHCMWHSNKGPRLHSTSVCLYKSPMCRNYTCNVFFSGLKGFCCAALRGSPVFTVLWNHLQTLHLMGQSSGLDLQGRCFPYFCLPLITPPPHLDDSATPSSTCLKQDLPLDASSPAGVPMSFTGIFLHSRVHPVPYLQVWFCTLEIIKIPPENS